MTYMTDSFMHPKRGIHSIQSLVLNQTVHSKRLGLYIISGAFLYTIKGRNSKFGMWMHLGCQVLCTIFGSAILTSVLSPRIIVSQA